MEANERGAAVQADWARTAPRCDDLHLTTAPHHQVQDAEPRVREPSSHSPYQLLRQQAETCRGN